MYIYLVMCFYLLIFLRTVPIHFQGVLLFDHFLNKLDLPDQFNFKCYKHIWSRTGDDSSPAKQAKKENFLNMCVCVCVCASMRVRVDIYPSIHQSIYQSILSSLVCKIKVYRPANMYVAQRALFSV